MTPEQITLIITTVLDLLKVALGALLGVWITSFTLNRTERGKVQKELGKYQFTIVSENVSNKLLLHLQTLKDFFRENYGVMAKHKENNEFFREWLQLPFIGQEIADPSWTNEKIAKLKNDVQKLKV